MEFSAKRIQLPKQDLFYEVPVSPDGKKQLRIPLDYLSQRLDYLIQRLKKSIDQATSKHHTDKREDLIRKTDELRKQITQVFEKFDYPSVNSQNQLSQWICEPVEKLIRAFKSEREGANLKVIAQDLELFFRAERDAIGELFELPEKYDRANGRYPVEGVTIFGSEEEWDDETADLLREVGERPHFFRSLIEIHVSLKGQLEAHNVSLGYVQRFHDLLNSFHRILFESGLVDASMTADMLKRRNGEIKKLLSLFPTPEKLEELPESVAIASNELIKSYAQILDAMVDVRKQVFEAEKVVGEFREKQPEIENLIAEGQRIISLVKQPDFVWSEGYGLFIKLCKMCQKTRESAKELKGYIEGFKKAAEEIFGSNDIRSTVEKVLPFLPEEAGQKIKNIFELYRNSSEDSEAQDASTPAPEEAEEEGTAADGKGDAKKRVHWRMLSPKDKRREIISRIGKQWKLFGYLSEKNRWQDMRLVFERMNDNDLRKVGLSRACFDALSKDAPYKSKDELLKDVFPEAYAEAVSPQFTSNVTIQGKFSWSKKGRVREEIQSEARRRFHEGWPLIRDMETEGRWQELKELFEFIRLSDIPLHFKLSGSCIGAEGAPYTTKEECLRDLWPEAFKAKEGGK